MLCPAQSDLFGIACHDFSWPDSRVLLVGKGAEALVPALQERGAVDMLLVRDPAAPAHPSTSTPLKDTVGNNLGRFAA